MSIGNYNGVDEILSQIEPSIRILSSDPRGWWQSRKKYSRFSENIAKAYVLAKLRDIKIKGQCEADRFAEKLIFNNKSKTPSEIMDFVSKNQGIWADFIYKTAASFDSEALASFFVPFIYGGVISRKNASNEAFGAVVFEDDQKSKPLKARITNAIRKIEELRRLGITLIIVEGCAEAVYSTEMLSLYERSMSEAFIIIEREVGRENTSLSGKSAYDRAVLSKLGASKNVLILLKPYNDSFDSNANTQNDWLAGKSRALSSYNVLHGIYGITNRKVCAGCKQGSVLAFFDPEMSLRGAVGGLISSVKHTDRLRDLLPRELVDFISSPALPVELPDLYELLIVSQFIISGGNIKRIRTEIV